MSEAQKQVALVTGASRGIGAAIASQVHAISSAVPVESLGVPTQFITHDKPDAILARFGLNADGIVASVRGLVS